MSKVEVVAEVGICHRGSLQEALNLMTMAAGAGCDTVKFQTRVPRKSVPESQWKIRKKTPFWAEQGIDELSYIEYKEKLEIPHLKYGDIDEHAKRVGIKWSTSFWDIETLEKITSWYRLPWIKIPSAHCTNLELIEVACRIASKQDCGLYLSTGMTTPEELDTTMLHVRHILGTYADDLVTLFHTNSCYPTKLDEVNLSCIKTLEDRYGCRVGYSGHEMTILTSCAALCYGAKVVERHITLNRDGGATDDPLSLENVGLCKLVRGIRDMERAMGDGKKQFFESEQFFKTKLRTG